MNEYNIEDTDGDGLLNNQDNDDDGDGILTKDELNEDGTPKDEDEDEVPDCIDACPPNEDGDENEITIKVTASNSNLCGAEELTLTTSVLGDYENLSYQWGVERDGEPILLEETSDQLTVSEAGNYLVLADNGDGCRGTASFEVVDGGTSNDLDITVHKPAEDGDNDGIPNSEEDADGDGDWTNDDTDQDGIPNYLDDDDDGDGTPSADEQRRCEDSADPLDCDGDGVPNHLDPKDDVATETDCANGMDDGDGDGYVGCDDLDCFEELYARELHRPTHSRNSSCPSISDENIRCILEYKDNLKRIGIFSRDKALSFCLNGYEEIIIIGEGLTGNATFNCLLNTLLFNNGQESLFDNTIRKFQYSFPARLHFDISANYPIPGSLCKFSSGCTYLKEIENNKITIYLDPNQSVLDMVATILHEGIHASIGAYLNGIGVDVKLLDTKRLHELYASNKNDANTLDHRYMTETYIIPISEALRQLDRNKHPLEYYYGFAWDGLRDFVTNDSQTDPNAYDQYKSIVLENFELCN